MVKIKDVPMFSNLDKKFHKELYDNIYIRHFTKNSIVFYEGDSSDYLHILLDGQVRLYKTSPKDTMIQLHRLNAPSIIGEYACLEQVPFPATCEFISERGTVGLLHFKKVMNYLKDPTFSLALLKSMTNKVMMLSSLVHKETILSSEAKVADLILNETETFNKIKNNEIASILNITPETLSRILSKLKKEKIIVIINNIVQIHNLEALHIIIEKNTLKSCGYCISKVKR
ncbi:MAG TPA: Crp/Fnr family transcriptional regulator [Campylobacterales bacterium]|nr:Crp/Fnr family transcriptional regulator [Campylobacterales bacterium]HIP41850.1 Crp/Fnr family transcriptional regulator [Campylobacterales bacterium]